MKTVEELYQETTDAIERRGRSFVQNEAVTLEENLVEAQKLLESLPVRKRNGRGDNSFVEQLRESGKEALVEAGRGLGLTEAEALVFAGVETEDKNSLFSLMLKEVD